MRTLKQNVEIRKLAHLTLAAIFMILALSVGVNQTSDSDDDDDSDDVETALVQNIRTQI